MSNEIALKLRNSIIKINCRKRFQNTFGTGFFISNNGYILTALHVVCDVAPNEKGQIIYDYGDTHIILEGQEVKVLPVISLIHHDIAIMKAMILSSQFLSVGSCGEVSEGEEVWFGGYGYSDKGTIHRSIVSCKYRQQDIDYIFLDTLCALRGFSGAPIVSSAGKVIAMLTISRHVNSKELKEIKDKIANFLSLKGQDQFINGNQLISYTAFHNLLSVVEQSFSLGPTIGVDVSKAISMVNL